MKKAKIILSAAGLLSIIAGAFAFKAQHKFSGNYQCITGNNKTTFYGTLYTTTLKGSFTGITLTCTLNAGKLSEAVTYYVTAKA